MSPPRRGPGRPPRAVPRHALKLRLEPDVHAWVVAAARRDERSVNSFLARLLARERDRRHRADADEEAEA